ncbi:MAG: flagellar hook-associated protein FlgK [Gammaproteobacteria bacterium]
MTSSTFGIGLSGLLAAQQGLATTGHNIANVNTAGYSRQRVTFETRDPQLVGYGYTGKGVDVQSIKRVANEFLVDQLRTSTANEARAAKMSELVSQVDAQLGDALISGGVQNFFDSLGDANDDPRLMASRQVLLESARSMVARFAEQEQQLNALGRSVNQQIVGNVQKINALTQAIASVNVDIARGAGLASGEPPNDLLDRRDQLLNELSELVGVQTQSRNDGMVNVVLGDGQLVVTGGVQSPLRTSPNPLDASRVEVSFVVGGALNQITESINGGELGALLDFRDETLEPARNAIGRLAASIAVTLNAQHRQGMDLNGAMGGDLFTIPLPDVNALDSNSGTIDLAIDPAQVSALSTSDYRLAHDGAAFTLTRLSDNQVQTLSGSGPFEVDGLVITVGSPPAAGDQYLLQPTKFVPRSMALATSDPRQLALASPVATATASANLSQADISRATVLDATDPNLLVPADLVFADPPTSFQIDGAGALIPYTSGADIDINGWRVQISGSPAPGDTFSVRNNAGGIGDNGNGLSLSELQFRPQLVGGTATYQESYGILVGEVGAIAQQSRISQAASASLKENAEAARDALSGVNLDEEAANLLRFQQAFQAAARVIAAADAAFQSLIEATRG